MTDKQIIIDGCDVSGCEYIDKDSCCNLFEGLIGTPCSSYHFRNCHYKQLKLAEQRIVEVNKTIQAKEQEYERLSSLIRKTQTYKNTCCDCRDDMLLYPSISGRTNYTQIEVEERSLRKIIQQLDQLKKQNDIMLNSLKKLQNKLCSSTSQCKYFLIDVLKEVENASK